MGWTRRMLVAAMVAAGTTGVLAVTPGDAQAGKPGGGGGTTSPAGQIVFTQIPATGLSHEVWLTDTLGNGSMFTLAGVDLRASAARARHGGKIWFFYWGEVSGTIGFGAARAELFAVREDGAKRVQLTDDVHFVGNRARVETLLGDAGISVPGCRWAYDSGGAPQVIESGHYTAPLEWDANGDIVATQPIAFTLRIPWDYSFASSGTLPRVTAGSAEYTLDGSTAVFGGDAATVWVADLSVSSSAPACTLVATGDGPRLSPDGSRVVYRALTQVNPTTYTCQGLWVWDVAGGGKLQVTNDSEARSPAWSPDSSAIAYVKQHMSRSTSRLEYSLRWAPARSGAASKVIGSYSNVSTVARWLP